MSPLWRPAPDHRRIVAVHEAGHWAAASAYRARRPQSTLTETSRGFRGKTTVRLWTATYLDEAVFVLAGAAAARLITGDPGLDGSTDLPRARRICRSIGVDLGHAEDLAATFARTHRRRIEQAADRLYRDGRL
jgi:hypothetical protein